MVCSMGYLGIRLGGYSRGGLADVTSVGECGGGGVVEERSGCTRDGRLEDAKEYSFDGAGESASWSSYAQGFTLGMEEALAARPLAAERGKGAALSLRSERPSDIRSAMPEGGSRAAMEAGERLS